MILLSKSRWKTVNYMLIRLLRVRIVLTFIPNDRMNEREERGIDPLLELPDELKHLLSSDIFWNGVEKLRKLLHPICAAVGNIIESDTSTMSNLYAAFFFMFVLLLMYRKF